MTAKKYTNFRMQIPNINEPDRSLTLAPPLKKLIIQGLTLSG